MQADRPTKSRAKRAKTPAKAARPPQPSLAVQIGFQLPEWNQLPTSAPQGSTVYRIWDDLGTKISNLCLSESSSLSGNVLFDIDVPIEPDGRGGMPEDSALKVANEILIASVKMPAWGTDKPRLILQKFFDEYGEVKVVGRFTPGHKPIAPPEELRDTSGQKAIIDAESPVSEESPIPSSSLPPEQAGEELRHADVKYAELMEKFQSQTHALRKQIAAELGPALNARIRMPDMPHDTLERKRELARWVMAQIEPLGLAVEEPRTGRPGKLRGNRGSWAGVGSFEIEVKIDDKSEVPTTSNSLPVLRLMDADPPEEVKAQFRELVKRKVNRTFVDDSHTR